jgi:hypothetical protein
MKLILLATVCLLFVSLPVSLLRGDDDDAVLEKDIATMSAAYAKQDYGTVVDMMYAPAVQAGGGKENLLAQLKTAAGAAAFISIAPIKPYTRLSGAKNDYVIIPTRALLKIDADSYEAFSSELAIRPHGGTAWQYIDGSGITPQVREMFFIDLPANATFPRHYAQKLRAPDGKATGTQ